MTACGAGSAGSWMPPRASGGGLLTRRPMEGTRAPRWFLRRRVWGVGRGPFRARVVCGSVPGGPVTGGRESGVNGEGVEGRHAQTARTPTCRPWSNAWRRGLAIDTSSQAPSASVGPVSGPHVGISCTGSGGAAAGVEGETVGSRRCRQSHVRPLSPLLLARPKWPSCLHAPPPRRGVPRGRTMFIMFARGYGSCHSVHRYDRVLCRASV